MPDLISFRGDDALQAWLADRAKRMLGASPGTQARTELALWRDCLDAELGQLRLTLAQTCCLADIVLGTVLDPTVAAAAAPPLYHCAADAFAGARSGPGGELASYGRKWEVDEAQLLEWLRRLTPTQDVALRDALSRWWDADGEPTVEGFGKLGLAVVEEEV